LFTGQRLDGTGLYYYNARYYDPTIGRFISADTVIQNPANPQCLNRYSYCLNNPLKYTDPSGQVVVIAGVDVRDIEKAVKSGDYSKLCEIGQKTAGSGNLLIAYGTLRGVEKEKCENLENSRNVFNIMWKNTGGSGETKFAGATIGPDGEIDSYDVKLPNSVRNDPDGGAVLTAHEFGHCSRYDKFGYYSEDSKYEEAVCMRFMAHVASEIEYSSSLATFAIIYGNILFTKDIPLERESGDFILRCSLNCCMTLAGGYWDLPVFPSDPNVDTYLRNNYLSN
jgi:RHS repeat-associated protein